MEITQEQKDSLREIGVHMNAQNNRSTAYPIFIIESLEKVYRDSSWGYEKSERKEDFNSGDLCEKCQELELNGDELPDYCEDCDQDCFVFFNEEYKPDLQAGFFFTEFAANEHLRLNGYHYKKPRTYVISAWRNNEVQTVMKILSSLGSPEGVFNHSYR